MSENVFRKMIELRCKCGNRDIELESRNPHTVLFKCEECGGEGTVFVHRDGKIAILDCLRTHKGGKENGNIESFV